MLVALSNKWLDPVVQLLNAPFRYPAVWIPTAFLMGACVGSLLNVCILRLPKGRSLIWPGSTCGVCFQRIRWRDNIPLVSYWLLRGRCRYCGTGFSSLYFWIELLTACSFAGLWIAEVVFNVRSVGTAPTTGYTQTDRTDLALIWLFHVFLISILIVAVATTMHGDPVARRLYRFGMMVGLLGAALGSWPWPVTATAHAAPTPVTFTAQARGETVLIPSGLQAWPAWLFLARGLRAAPPIHGVLTALVGALAGLGLARAHTLLADTVPRAQSIQNELLLMMIGTFAGWQGIFLIVPVAVGLSLVQRLAARHWPRLGNAPFCLFVALATVVMLLGSGRLSLTIALVGGVRS